MAALKRSVNQDADEVRSTSNSKLRPQSSSSWRGPGQIHRRLESPAQLDIKHEVATRDHFAAYLVRVREALDATKAV
jgi:hypothetical protein